MNNENNADINSVILVGRLTKEPQIAEKFGMISIAVDHSYKEKKETCFIDCKVFNEDVALLFDLKKGQQITVLGRLKLDSWEDKNTKQKRYKHVIMIEEIKK